MKETVNDTLPLKHVLLFIALSFIAVIQTAQASDPNNGRVLYMQHCNTCHEPGREIAGAPDFNYGSAMMQSDMSLLGKIRLGKNAMPGYTGILTDRMILDIISYMRTF